MKYLIAHDIGTSGNKATLFSEEGTLLKSVNVPYTIYYGPNGEAEQNPEDWWKSVCDATSQLLTLVDKRDIAAMSLCGHMMGCLCVDESGRPLRSHIMWCDTRSGEQAAYIENKIGNQRVYEITGHQLSSSYSLTKLMWIKQYQPDIYKDTYKILHSKDYIAFKLTGEMVTDYSDASGTLSYNIQKHQWDDEMITAAELDMDKYPEIKDGTKIVGYVTKEASEECGLLKGTPIVLGGGDGPVSGIGAGCFKKGRGYACLGTSAWNSVCSETVVQSPEKNLVTWNHVVPELYNIAGTMQSFGAAIAWTRNTFCQKEEALSMAEGKKIYEYMDDNVKKSPVGSNGLLFLPYLLGERAPYCNADAKGVFAGLTLNHNHDDILRSVYEGIAMNMGLIFRALKSDVDIEDAFLIAGGAAKNRLLLQILADVYDSPLYITNHVDEIGAIGGAILGGYATGLFGSMDVMERFAQKVETIYPIPENVKKYKNILPVFEECYNCLVDIFPKIGN